MLLSKSTAINQRKLLLSADQRVPHQNDNILFKKPVRLGHELNLVTCSLTSMLNSTANQQS